MKYKNLLILLVILCFACDKDDNIEETCSKINGDFVSVSGWLQLERQGSGFFRNVSFINDDFGIISNSTGRFYKTNSGGLCWEELEELEDEFGGSLFRRFFILNENDFFTSGKGLYKTNDGGDTFKEIKTNGVWGGSNTFDMHFFNENRGIILKGGGNLYKTEDGGLTWANVHPQSGFAQRLQFVTPSIGYLYGGSQASIVDYGEINKTIDGGNTWFKIESEPNITKSGIRSLYFINENFGYFVNNLEEIYVTQNGGITWTLRATVNDSVILDMVFINVTLGYILGARTIYKTEDGGFTWIEDYKNTEIEGQTILSSITKTPNGSIFVVGRKGLILKKE